MPKFSDIANVTQRGHNIPLNSNGTSKEEVPSNAWLVWSYVTEKVKKARHPETGKSSDGRLGYIWKGSLSNVITDLWPTIPHPYNEYSLLTNEEKQSYHFRQEIGSYLKHSGNMECLKRGNKATTSVWWISMSFNEMTFQQARNRLKLKHEEQKLSPQEAGEDRAPAPIMTRYQCQHCSKSYKRERDRNQHEWTDHKPRRSIKTADDPVSAVQGILNENKELKQQVVELQTKLEAIRKAVGDERT